MDYSDEDIRSALKKFKVPELKKIAKRYNMHRRIAYSKLKKQELIDALVLHLSFLLGNRNDEFVFFK